VCGDHLSLSVLSADESPHARVRRATTDPTVTDPATDRSVPSASAHAGRSARRPVVTVPYEDSRWTGPAPAAEQGETGARGGCHRAGARTDLYQFGWKQSDTMAMYCPNCGESVSENDTFCGECGTALDDNGGGGGSGWGDNQNAGQNPNTGQNPNAGWEGNQNAEQNPNAGWGDNQNAGRNPNAAQGGAQGGRGQPQQAPPQGAQGGRGQPQQAPPQGGPGMQGGVAGIPRMSALDTFVQGIKWLVAVPVLLGAFILVDVVGTLGQLVTGLFSLAGSILTLLVYGAAYRYTEQFVYDGEVRGGVDGLLDTVSDVASRLLALIGIGLIYLVAVAVGFLFLVVPGIYLGARLVLAFPACVLDGKGVTDSLSTSWDVASGNVLKLVGLGFINFIALFGVGIFAGILAAVIGGLSAVESPVFTLAIIPVTSVLGGAVQMAVARVYLENRPPEPQPQGQQAGGYQQEPTQY
jgi:hypothetical protein